MTFIAPKFTQKPAEESELSGTQGTSVSLSKAAGMWLGVFVFLDKKCTHTRSYTQFDEGSRVDKNHRLKLCLDENPPGLCVSKSRGVILAEFRDVSDDDWNEGLKS